jgi:hypothetical protein
MAVKAADQVSIVDVTDAYSVILTSEAYTFPGTTSAAKAGSCTTQVMCFQGSDEVAFSIGTITCPTGVTASTGTDGKTVTITASTSMTAAGDVIIPVAITGTDVTIQKRFSCGIAFTGATGAKGETGASGKGIKSTATTYQVGTSGTTAPTGTWSSTVVATTAPGQFLWTRTVTTYTDNTSTTAYTVAAHGATGDKGDTGATGKGVKSTAVTYQLSSSGTDVPTGTWSNSPLAPTTTQYLWTKTVTTYTDGTTSTAYSVGGKVGATGAKGDTGAKGADAITIAVTSDNGTVFKNSAGSTTLTAHVYKAGAELTGTALTALGTLKWYKDGGTTAVGTGATLSVSASSVNSKSVYTVKLEG